MTALPPPPSDLLFKARFNGSASSLVETHSPLSHEVAPETEWPDADAPVSQSGLASPSGGSSRQSSGQHGPAKGRWHLKTEQELYLTLLEQRLAEVKHQRPTGTPSRRSSSPSHLSNLVLPEDVEDAEDPFSGDEEEDESESESGESERPLLPSPAASRRASAEPAIQPVPITGRIAFAPVVRIAAGIRSIAGSFTPYSGAPSRSTSPASSIYAPLLPPSGAPGAALKQAAKYGTIVPPAQTIGRQTAVPGTPSSPYKSLAKAQSKRKRSRRRKKKWIKFRRKCVAGLRWFFGCGCLSSGHEDGRVHQ